MPTGWTYGTAALKLQVSRVSNNLKPMRPGAAPWLRTGPACPVPPGRLQARAAAEADDAERARIKAIADSKAARVDAIMQASVTFPLHPMCR